MRTSLLLLLALSVGCRNTEQLKTPSEFPKLDADCRAHRLKYRIFCYNDAYSPPCYGVLYPDTQEYTSAKNELVIHGDTPQDVAAKLDGSVIVVLPLANVSGEKYQTDGPK